MDSHILGLETGSTFIIFSESQGQPRFRIAYRELAH